MIHTAILRICKRLLIQGILYNLHKRILRMLIEGHNQLYILLLMRGIHKNRDNYLKKCW